MGNQPKSRQYPSGAGESQTAFVFEKFVHYVSIVIKEKERKKLGARDAFDASTGISR